MGSLPIVMLIAVTCVQFLVSRNVLPGLFNYVPELLAITTAAVVVIRGPAFRLHRVPAHYWVLFGALIIVVTCGSLVNGLGPGPLFSGIRTYLRGLPFFFLAFAISISESQFRRQLVTMLLVCLLQLPLSGFQRWQTVVADRLTGDDTYGTMMNSGHLSLFLIGAACVLIGLNIRSRLNLPWLVISLLCVLLPTTINETKITIFLLPLAVFVTFVIGAERGRRLRAMAIAATLIFGFMSIFLPIYDHFILPRYGYGLVDFLTMEGRVEGYLFKGTEVGQTQAAGKLDGIVVGVQELLRDPAIFAFGLGIGNASESALGPQFSGAYARLFESFPLTSLSYVLLEMGILGVGLVLALHFKIFRECLVAQRHENDLVSAFAIGWAGVSAVMLVALTYTQSIANPALSFPFWYFSGVIASKNAEVNAASSVRAKPQ